MANYLFLTKAKLFWGHLKEMQHLFVVQYQTKPLYISRYKHYHCWCCIRQ
uniref:Uncharacterized protein n=1 Tax=Arundo donax TaxID=35708 RepID=A0A0A9A4B9_ARUDO